MVGTRGSGIVSSAADVLWMSVVRGMRGVCEMCMCLARGGVGGEEVRGLGLGFTNPVGNGGVLDVCLCFGCGGSSKNRSTISIKSVPQITKALYTSICLSIHHYRHPARLYL